MVYMRRIRLCAIVVCLLFARQFIFGQKLPAGPQVLTFFSDVDDSEQPYGLYLPKDFNSAKKYPLVISLHGAGSNHRLNLRRVFGKSNASGENDTEASRYFPEWKDIDYIVASPLARGTLGYQGVPEKDVMDVLADVKKRFPIDENRIYLTGLSMGGGGTLWIALSHPDIWAAIAPVCPAAPDGTVDLAPNALAFPVAFHQGGSDPLVQPSGTREWAKRLQDLGTKVEYTEYPGVGHNSWENAYKDEAIFAWFSKFRRDPYPNRVRFVSRAYKYNSSFWVRFDELVPGTIASIDAKFTASNKIEITTSDLSGFTLLLKGHPKFSAGRMLEISINGKAFKVEAKDSVSFSQRDGFWVAEKAVLPANAKRRGAEGPMSEAVASRHIYVYGTGDNTTQTELLARRNQAMQAANWGSGGSFMGSRTPLIELRAIPDSQIRPSDLSSSNLILFGTKDTNRIIAKFSDRLPMHFAGSGEEYGLAYIYPIDEHYVIISSGLQWWTTAEPQMPMMFPQPGRGTAPPGSPAAADTATQGRSTIPSGEPSVATTARRIVSFLSGAASALGNNRDYVLFKGTPDNVIAEGRFDQNWRIPEADAAKLLASGAVALSGR